MIASKLILFFCFCLLLDNSLGKTFLLDKPSTKKYLESAIDYGKKYGGKLGELVVHLRSLSRQIDEGKVKVGFSNAELRRFNDSANEVDLAKSDVDYYEELQSKYPSPEYQAKLDAAKKAYSDKVEALVALRSNDIITDEDHIEKLKEQKQRVIISLIIRMEHTQEKFKDLNVRKKVKEAKDNGLKDSDIKKILFEEYFRQSSVPQIGTKPSTVDALLSSFRAGMEYILDGRYYQKLGWAKFGYRAGDDDDSVKENIPEEVIIGDSGDEANEPEGGDDPKYISEIDDYEDDEEPDDEEPDDDDDGDDPKYTFEDDEDDGDDELANPEEYLATRFLKSHLGPGLEEPVNLEDVPDVELNFTDAELVKVEDIVDEQLDLITADVVEFENELSILQEEEIDGYRRDSSLREPIDRELNDTEKLALYNRRVEHLKDLLDTADDLIEEYNATREQLLPKFDLITKNLHYYAQVLRRVTSNEEKDSSLSTPAPLAEFGNLSNDTDRMRYLLSNIAWIQNYLVIERCDIADRILKDILESLESSLAFERRSIFDVQNRPRK